MRITIATDDEMPCKNTPLRNKHVHINPRYSTPTQAKQSDRINVMCEDKPARSLTTTTAITITGKRRATAITEGVKHEQQQYQQQQQQLKLSIIIQ